jgi:acetyl-CoA synthetase
MDASIAVRMKEILDLFSAPDANASWLLCDRHPPDETALILVSPDSSVTTVTYGELADSSRRFAAVLTARGIGRGDRVATLMGKSADLLTVLLGIWRVGAVYVPLFTAFAEGAVTSRLASASVKLVVVDENQRSKVPDGQCQLLVAGATDKGSEHDLTHQLSAVQPGATPAAAVGGDGAFVHMLTSGTTGTPKGVVQPVRYIAGWCGYLEFGLGVRPDSTFWCGADPGWAYGFYTAIVAPLAMGVATILVQGGFTAAATWNALSTLKVTHYAAAPTVFRGLMASDVPVPENLALQRLSSAGEPLTPDVNEWAEPTLGLAVHDHYGQTEVGMVIGFPHHPALEIPVQPGAMGVALPGWEVTVLRHDDDVPAGAGELGRLAVVIASSPFMTFSGYADGRGDVGRFVGGGAYYVTGDAASMDSEGVVWFSARDDDVIIMAGYRIGPFDVESILLRHPSVDECAVIPVPDRVRGEVVEAFVVLKNGIVGDTDLVSELQAWVKQKYAAHAYPRRVHFVGALPKTPSGKVQRTELRRQRRAEVEAASRISFG